MTAMSRQISIPAACIDAIRTNGAMGVVTGVWLRRAGMAGICYRKPGAPGFGAH